MKYSQTLINDEYKSSNLASQKVFLVISILITLRSYTHLSAIKYTMELIVTDINLKNITGIIGDGMGIK